MPPDQLQLCFIDTRLPLTPSQPMLCSISTTLLAGPSAIASWSTYAILRLYQGVGYPECHCLLVNLCYTPSQPHCWLVWVPLPHSLPQLCPISTRMLAGLNTIASWSTSAILHLPECWLAWVPLPPGQSMLCSFSNTLLAGLSAIASWSTYAVLLLYQHDIYI